MSGYRPIEQPDTHLLATRRMKIEKHPNYLRNLGALHIVKYMPTSVENGGFMVRTIAIWWTGSPLLAQGAEGLHVPSSTGSQAQGWCHNDLVIWPWECDMPYPIRLDVMKKLAGNEILLVVISSGGFTCLFGRNEWINDAPGHIAFAFTAWLFVAFCVDCPLE